MDIQSLFLHAFIYLCAALFAILLGKRLGVGAVLGYLLVGILIGPWGLKLIAGQSQDVMHFAEFGVVMMLFLIGLELQPAMLWSMRRAILGLGGLQVIVTAVAIAVVAITLGLSWQAALAVGLILSLSSTAIILQTLTERGLMRTDAGKGAFAVLLFQDIAVIPIIAALPLLATYPEIHSARRPWRGRENLSWPPRLGAGSEHHCSGLSHHFSHPLAFKTRVSNDCRDTSARGIHRRCAGLGHRCSNSHDHGRTVSRTGCLRSRGGAG